MYSVNDVIQINENNQCLVYNNGASKNILFMGGCRVVPQMYYYNSITKDRNIYCILVFTRIKLDDEYVKSIIKNTDIIVCENIEHYGIMNTNVDCPVTFFKHFGVRDDTRIYHIPNLELHMYHYDVINVYKIPKNDVYAHFLTSKNRLKNRMIQFGYSDLWDDFEDNLQKLRLFSTFNHPTRILSCMLFKYLSRKMGLNVDASHFEEFMKHSFLEGIDSPIFQEDIDTYNFTFHHELCDSEKLNIPNTSSCAILSKVDTALFIDK